MRGFAFIPKMAWRDSRASRWRLLLFSISITLGIAALVALGSLRRSLTQAIDEQARTLIGADLIVESSRPSNREQEAMLHSLGERQAREVRFRTMAVFLKSGSTRLVQVRALGGEALLMGEWKSSKAFEDVPEHWPSRLKARAVWMFVRTTRCSRLMFGTAGP